MKRRQALVHARKILEDNRIENASLEGEILLRYALGIDRAVLFASLDEEIDTVQSAQLDALLERRRRGEPSAYVTGRREFYGIEFKVDNRVLIPRPETEVLVEKAISFCRQNGCKTIADIGAGSGCIAVSIARNLPGVTIYAIDNSLPALEAAKENISTHGLLDRIKPMHGNLLEPLTYPVDVIAANLPYVNKAEVDARYEPKIALDGGIDGLDKIRELITQLPGKLTPGGMLLLEIGLGQAAAVEYILHRAFPGAGIEIIKDLAGIDRIVALRLTPSSLQC